MKNRYLLFAFILFGFNGCNNIKKDEHSLIDDPETKLGWKLGAGTYTFNRFTFLQSLDKIDSCNLKICGMLP